MNDKFYINQNVRFIDEDAHKWDPNLYPPVGSIGVVMRIDVDFPLIKWEDADGVYYLWTMADMLEAADGD